MKFRIAAALVLLPLAAFGKPMTPMASPASETNGSAEASMMGAMERMNQGMAAVPMTGDADRAFAGMMLPHHQGAIDMARFELAHGHDPAMRRLARAIVVAQKQEIAQMSGWLARHPAQ